MLSVAKAAARDASDLILYANETDRKSSNKSTITDLVTETDKKNPKNKENVIARINTANDKSDKTLSMPHRTKR